MARKGNDVNSAGSQFFIVLKDDPLVQRTLDNQYTVFGRVIEGMDVVDKIAALKTDPADAPPTNPEDARILSVKIEQR